jgi:hypothetical protein
VDLQSSDHSPKPSEEDKDDVDTYGEDEDAIIFTKGSVRYTRSNRSQPRHAKRKARKPVATSSSNESPTPLRENEVKRRSKLADSTSGSEAVADIQRLVRRKRVTKLTAAIRHRVDKKQKPEEKKKKKKNKYAHTEAGRADERVFKATQYLEVFNANQTIRKCSDVDCKCPSTIKCLIAGRTLSHTMAAGQRKQWLLEKMTDMAMDWTYFIINRNKACRLCFEAYYGLKVKYCEIQNKFQL